MGKKHKKHHHRSNILAPEANEPKPLKLVLKMGSGASSRVVSPSPPPPPPTSTFSVPSRRIDVAESFSRAEKKKKKKKKKTKSTTVVESPPPPQPMLSEPPLQFPSPGIDYSIVHRVQKHKHKHHRPKHKKREMLDSSAPTTDLGGGDSGLGRRTSLGESLKLRIPSIPMTMTGMERYTSSSSSGAMEMPMEMLATNRPDRMKDKKLKADLLRYIFALQRKDVHKFFAMPVSDSFAPGYSRIIKKPMDFKKLRTKIDKSAYSSVDDFKDDVELMCVNCTVYNGRDTIYYREAVKLLAHAIKLMKNDLSPAKQVMPASLSLANATGTSTRSTRGADEEINVTDVDGTVDSRLWLGMQGSRHYGLLNPSESVTPNLDENADEIAQQTAEMAEEARLRVKQKGNKMGILHCADDGSTRLTFLNPDANKENASSDVTLGSLAGGLQQGRNQLGGVSAEKGKKAQGVPVSYLFYGPFSSFAPLANPYERKDIDELVTTYGDKTGVQYAQSLQRFVEDASSQAHAVVAELLTSLTDGKHAALMKKKAPTEKIKPSRSEEKKEDASLDVNIESLLSLEKEGIDVSFLTDIAGKLNPAESMQRTLDENAQRLDDLQDIQNKRLGSSAAGDGAIASVSSVEKELGLEIAKNLTDAIAKVEPKEVVPADGVGLALGLSNSGDVPRESSSVPANSGFSLLKQLGLDSDDDDDE
ncbi:bromodomain-containing protein 9-like [Oscarella lobularis]|uniref:bromodomain-containing protein 9-like n=1 Tax=Oscarella lobularis TaxID=121494 RepID=UPI003313708A